MTGVASCYFGQVLGDEVEDVDCRFVLRICFCEFVGSGIEGLPTVEGDALMMVSVRVDSPCDLSPLMIFID